MRKRLRLLSVVFVLVFGTVGLVAQDYVDVQQGSKKTRKEKREEVKSKKLQSNNEKLTKLLNEKDLVIMDDGIGRGLQVGSGLHNFFRIEGDTITVQKIRIDDRGTSIQSDRDLYKSQGLIREISVVDGTDGNFPRAVIRYSDILSFEPRIVLIYVYANRVEARYDDGTRVFIRGKLVSNNDVSLQEIGQNSSTLLLNQSTWKTPDGVYRGLSMRNRR